MLIYAVYAAIAFYVSRLLARKFSAWPHAIWVVPIAASAGVIAGTALALIVLPLLGLSLDKNTLPTQAARAFWYGVIAAGAAFFLKRGPSTVAASTQATSSTPKQQMSTHSVALLSALAGGGVVAMALFLLQPWQGAPASDSFDPSRAQPVQQRPTEGDFNPQRAVPVRSEIEKFLDGGSNQPLELTEQQIEIERLVLDNVRPGWREKVASERFNRWIRTLSSVDKQRYDQAVTAEKFAAFLDTYDRWTE